MSNTKRINFNFSPCSGVGFTNDDDPRVIDWREGCEDCLRRTTPGLDHRYLIKPPDIIAFECEFYISPETK